MLYAAYAACHHMSYSAYRGESKKTPTDPWNIPQILNYLFMKEIPSYLNFGVPGVCSRGLLELS